MPQVNISFVVLGRSPVEDAGALNVVRAEVSSVGPITVTATPTAPGSRPAAPSAPEGFAYHRVYARVTNRGTGGDVGPVRVAFGTDPTAEADGTPVGLWIEPGHVEMVGPLTAGQLLSFIQAA